MTNWYVSSLASGGGDGSSGNPWNLTEAIAEHESAINVINGDTIWLKSDGIYITSGITLTRTGSAGGFIRWSGYTSVIEDLGKATIERSGGTGVLLNTNLATYTIFENLILDGKNAGTSNFIQGQSSKTIRIESKNAGTAGILGHYIGGSVVNCSSHDNGANGIQGGGDFIIVYHIIMDFMAFRDI